MAVVLISARQGRIPAPEDGSWPQGGHSQPSAPHSVSSFRGSSRQSPAAATHCHPEPLLVAGIREYARQHKAAFTPIEEAEVRAWLGGAQPTGTGGTAFKGRTIAAAAPVAAGPQGGPQPTYSLFAYPAYDNYAGVMYPLSSVQEVQARSNKTHFWKVGHGKGCRWLPTSACPCCNVHRQQLAILASAAVLHAVSAAVLETLFATAMQTQPRCKLLEFRAMAFYCNVAGHELAAAAGQALHFRSEPCLRCLLLSLPWATGAPGCCSLRPGPQA